MKATINWFSVRLPYHLSHWAQIYLRWYLQKSEGMLTYQNNLDCSWDLQSLWCALNVVNLLLLVQVTLQISWFYIERKEWMASCAIILNIGALIRSRRSIHCSLKTTWEIVFSDTNNANINHTITKKSITY